MNVLLTTATAPKISSFSTDEKLPPMGLLQLAAILRNNNHNVFFKDSYSDPTDILTSNYLDSNKIDVVGIYYTTICYEDVIKKLQFLKMKHSNIKRIVGGPGVTILSKIDDYDKKNKFFELANTLVTGEADNKINDIVSNINNPFWIDCGITDNIEDLPIPAYDLIDFNKYHGITVSTSRGCPRSCSFCSNQTIGTRKYRSVSAQKIVDTIKYLQLKYKIDSVYFRENNFCVNEKRICEFCHLILSNNITIKWKCEASSKDLDIELLKAMKKSGCEGIYIGFESNSQNILSKLKPGFVIKDNELAIRNCNEVGIPVYGSFIIGFPDETVYDLQETIDFTKKYKFEATWFNIFIGIPGSPIYDTMDYIYQDECGVKYTNKFNNIADKFYKSHIKFRVPINNK